MCLGPLTCQHIPPGMWATNARKVGRRVRVDCPWYPLQRTLDHGVFNVIVYGKTSCRHLLQKGLCEPQTQAHPFWGFCYLWSHRMPQGIYKSSFQLIRTSPDASQRERVVLFCCVCVTSVLACVRPGASGKDQKKHSLSALSLTCRFSLKPGCMAVTHGSV